MAKSTYSNRNNRSSERFKEVIITKETWEGFPNKHLFNNYKIAYFTDRLAYKAVEYVDMTDKIEMN